MLIQRGSLWDYHKQGHWICITTNGVVNTAGLLVMGKGLALEAAQRFPGLRHTLGAGVRQHGNVPLLCPVERIISFPTKHHYRDNSDLALIEKSATILRNCWSIVSEMDTMTGKNPVPICLPKVGCGLGGLDWTLQVAPLLGRILDENYIVVI